MTALAQKECTPCQGGIDPMEIQDAKAMLDRVQNWRLVEGGKKLYRKFTFNNFKQAQAFVNQVGDVAEAEQHHPDIHFGWGYAEIEIQTHAIGGLHENDFILAAKIDELTS